MNTSDMPNSAAQPERNERPPRRPRRFGVLAEVAKRVLAAVIATEISNKFPDDLL